MRPTQMPSLAVSSARSAHAAKQAPHAPDLLRAQARHAVREHDERINQ
jgi:hypothetical protein